MADASRDIWQAFLEDGAARVDRLRRAVEETRSGGTDVATLIADELGTLATSASLLGLQPIADLAADGEALATLAGDGAVEASLARDALAHAADALVLTFAELAQPNPSGENADLGPVTRARAEIVALLSPTSSNAASARPRTGEDPVSAAPGATQDDSVWNPQVDEDMIDPFVDECTERLEGLAQKLVAMEGTSDPELVHEVFRDLHTIKGSAGFVGLQRMNRLAHAAEDLMGRVRDGRYPADATLVDVLLAVVDALRRILERAVQRAPIDLDIEPLLARLRAPSTRVPPAEQAPAPPDLPSNPTDPGRAAKPTLRVDFDKLDTLLNLVGELVIGKAALHGGVEGLTSLAQALELQRRNARRLLVRQAGVPVSPRNDTTARLLAEEMTRIARVCGDLHQDLSESTGRLDRVAAELRDEVMKLRMVPVARLFGKYHRVVRELAQKLGKRVNLVVEGADTELDKLLIEQLDEPLLHLARNAVDHGIESPSARQAAGKSTAGTLVLRARHHGNQVHIAIEDDGAGMDPARLKEKAIEKGLLTRPEADAMSDRAALDLIFRPGFSTAAAVSDVSGRGVGMDVVHATIQRLKGTIDVESQPGRGSRVTLRLPLTLAIIQVLLARAGGETFALPLDTVMGTLHVPHAEVQRLHNREVVQVRQRQVPLIRLDVALGLEDDPSERSESVPVVLLGLRGETFGLVVDQLLGKREIVIKPLGDLLVEVPCVVGATLLGDRIALIVDLPAVLSRALEAPGAPPDDRPAAMAAQNVAPPGARHPRILLAEDSVTVRSALKRLLEQAGYQVVAAEDGAQALLLAQRSEQRFDLVSTDVMMPHMDGYELTRALRADPRYRDVPILMVTSRGEKIDRIRGFDAGVDEYILKPMDRGEILRAVGRHLAALPPQAGPADLAAAEGEG